MNRQEVPTEHKDEARDETSGWVDFQVAKEEIREESTQKEEEDNDGIERDIEWKREEETMGPFEVVLAGRLATTVRKQFTIAVPKNRGKKVDFLVFRWFKA